LSADWSVTSEQQFIERDRCIPELVAALVPEPEPEMVPALVLARVPELELKPEPELVPAVGPSRLLTG